MKTIKPKTWHDIPQGYTGIIEYENGDKSWYKNLNLHREDGPAWIYKNDYKQWYLNDMFIWDSAEKLNLTDQIILSKILHPNYPTVQVWKILDKDKVWEQIVIPGMEEFIIE